MREQFLKRRAPHRILLTVTFMQVVFLLLTGRDAGAASDRSPAAASSHADTCVGIPDAVKTAASGIVRVTSSCLIGSRVLSSNESTGFLIGTKQGDQVVLTTAEALSFTEKEMKTLAKKAGFDENVQPTERITVAFQGDIELEAQIISISEQRDLAVLSLNSSFTDKYSLAFASDEAKKDGVVYLISFPLSEKGYRIYSSRSTVIKKGILKGIFQDKQTGTKYALHTASGDDASCGAALVNEKGMVVGMHVLTQDQISLALPIKELTGFMELHGIGFLIYNEKRRSHREAVYILGGVTSAAFLFMLGQIIKLKKQRMRIVPAAKRL